MASRLRTTLWFSNNTGVNRLTCFPRLSPWRTHPGFSHKLITVTYVECFSSYWEFHMAYIPYLLSNTQRTVATPKDLKMDNSLIFIPTRELLLLDIITRTEQQNEKVRNIPGQVNVRVNSCSSPVTNAQKVGKPT